MRDHLSTIVPRTLEAITRPYPTGLVVSASGPGEWREHHERYPIFYGCYDWHSAVHSHWQLLRLLRSFPDHPETRAIRPALDSQFTPEAVRGEMESLSTAPGFEMPYGMAWVLQLGAELAEWKDVDADRWLTTLEPLVDHAADEFGLHLESRTLPVRTGTHNQTAFALGLAYDWAKTIGDRDILNSIEMSARRFYLDDINAPLAYEPSAVDFLSPSLAEADLMRRVLPPDEFAVWVDRFLPSSELSDLLAPQPVVDPSNGQLAHIAGLNMSRAWMAEGVASVLPSDHRLHNELTDLARRHRLEGYEAALHPDYMVSHWAPTFVVYLMTGRGLPQ